MSDPIIDADFNVRKTVTPATFDRILAEYRSRSDSAVRGLGGHTGICYDARSGQELDVWGIGGPQRPVFVVVHGGYWRALSRHDSAFMAAVLADSGIATVTVDYGLAPRTTLEEIVRQVRAAVAWVHHHGADYGLDASQVVVGGSSAGGHLAAEVAVPGWHADFAVPEDVVAAFVPISGLFDLRPLVNSFANEWLGLDSSRARQLSPIISADRSGPPALVVVAEHDGAGFLRQSREFHTAWSGSSHSELLIVPERNHYDIFLDLADAESALVRGLINVFDDLGKHDRPS